MTTRLQSRRSLEVDNEVQRWNQDISTLTARWRDITSDEPVQPAAWRVRLLAMQARQTELQRQGQWLRGPSDLMSICGVHRKELAHSAALRWLCDPSGSHGFGPAFLSELLAATGGTLGSVIDADAATEVARPTSRADLVVRTTMWTLVAELKIDAGESERQCQRLFDDWRGEPDLRLIFLTPSGRAPMTTTTAAAAAAWNCLSWSDILKILDKTLVVADRGAAPAVEEYRRTLRRIVGRRAR
jgi:hypothetical protein